MTTPQPPPEPRSFLYSESDGVATITLNRPERLNALTFEVYRELTETFRALQARRSVRVVVVTGTGKGFCSGGDVNDIIGELFERDAAGLLAFTRMTCDLVAAMRALDAPIVASLNGTVAGAGAVIAAACDIRIASETAKIAFLFVRGGLSGADMGASWLLPRFVGHGRATDILMTGDFVDARRAHEIGLYNAVVPAERVVDEATALAARLARGPAEALAVTKRALDAEWALDFEAALAHEADAQAALMERPDFREAYEAFMAKREPKFQA
jgi:enoyl-CoA hydratase/carnithine racemase